MAERTESRPIPRPSASPPGLLRRLRPAHVVVAVALLVTFLLVPRLVAGPRSVSRLTLVNGSAYDIRVEVTGAARDGWMTVGMAMRDRSTAFEDVLDQGDTWVFRFLAQGEDGGELTVARDRLARDGWRLEIPGAVARRLLARGAAPPP